MTEKMKNRHKYCKLFALAALLLACVACVEPVKGPVPDGSDDLYPISFRIMTQDDALRTKAGPLSGADALVDSLFMYCFDANGRYLGRYQAQILTQEPMNYTEGQTPGTFKGEIPPATARIHFVANADCPVGGDMIGLTERQVMNAPGLVYRTKSSRMSYWGYLRRATSSELAGLFDGSYSTIVWMVRDRLWIEAGSYDNTVFEDDISWVVYNGLNNGYIATFGLPDGSTVWDENNPYQELRHTAGTHFSLSTYVTPYPESGGRFKTTEADMVPFDNTKTGYMPMYVFDDECPVNNTTRVVKIIVKAKFKTGTQRTRYFPICITHGYSDEPVHLLRGHRYELDLKTLPEASGYDTFAGAAAALSFANGALVDIPDDVIEVSDGQFDMRVNYMMTYPLSGETFASTAVLVQESASSVEVPFEVKKQTTGIQDQTFNFSESAWLPAEEGTTPAHTNGTITWGAGINANKEASIGNPLNSTITLPLATVEEDNLKQSKYNLKGYYVAAVSQTIDQEVHHILMRNVDVYTIDRFRIQDHVYATSGNGYNSDGSLELTRNATTGIYTLKFKLPGGTTATGDHDKYPALLYPLQVKLATTTLQPTAVYINGVEQSNPVFGVQVRSTVPNTEPAMLSAQTSTAQWNYQSAYKPWNFWYTYPIASVPLYKGVTGEIQTGTTGEEVTGPEIRFDLKDMRNSSSFSTIPGNVGLYLYIEFFGPATSVSYTQAYVAATGVTLNYTTRQDVNRGNILQLTATVAPATATYKGVKWTSSDTSVATVDANGLVSVPSTADRNDEATITATTVDSNRTATVTIRAR